MQLTTSVRLGIIKLTKKHWKKEICAHTLCLVCASSVLATYFVPAEAADDVKPAATQTTPAATPAASTAASATPATTPSTAPADNAPVMNANGMATPTSTKGGDAVPKRVVIKKGSSEVEVSTKAEDLVPTDDADLAKQQVDQYPDSAEAAFIYATALTRTSRVEEALKEIRRARRLAEAQGGPAYFDKMITSYESMLKDYPDDNRIRYHLAWAYYMKAYIIARQSKRQIEYIEKMKQMQLAKEGKLPAPQAQAKPALMHLTSKGR